MEILFVTNLVPYPLDGGGKIKTFTTIQALSRENVIDLVCFYEKESIIDATKVLKQYCRSVKMIPIRVTTRENYSYMIKQALKCLFSSSCLSMYKFYSNEMREAISKLMHIHDYHVAYFDHLQLYSYKRDVCKENENTKCILDMHNCETKIFTRYAINTKNIIKKIYLNLEVKKLAKFEKWAVQDADKLIVLSVEDKKNLEDMCGTEINSEIIPIGVREPESKKEERKIDEHGEIHILFVGTLSWEPNNDGIIWFLENVIPKVQKSYADFKLYIVGKSPSDKVKRIASKYSNIFVTGYVDDVTPYYDMCDYMIVPLFFGSGQRVKILEAFSRGMPVLSTQIGAEGIKYTENEDILIADDIETFILHMNKLRNDAVRKKLSKNERRLYEQNYSLEAVGKKICSVLNDVLS